jgi:transcription termination/antitermination protein NusA
MGLSSLMEKLTRVRVKDCFKEEDTIYFVVDSGQLGKVIGKGGSNIKKLQTELGKKVRVFEYRDDVIDFVKNVIYPARVAEIVEEDGFVLIKDGNRKTKSMLIGRNGKNLALINRAVKRFFNKEVKVV